MLSIFFKMAAIFLESLNLFSNGDSFMKFGTVFNEHYHGKRCMPLKNSRWWIL